MAQGMEFRWMGGHPNEDELVRMEAARQDAQDLAQLQKANANATRAYDWMALGEQLGTSGAYQEAMAKQAAQEAQKAADMQRIKELQAKVEADKAADMQRIKELQEGIEADKSRMREDPRMQVAAMMMMGGQPGALQSLLVSSFQQDLQKEEKAKSAKKEAQAKMDALESSINNDLMYLAGTNSDQIDKALNVSVPLFEAKLQELIDAGATSRMGGLEAWKKTFADFRKKGQLKKDNNTRKKNRDTKLDF
jgi:hypothetical protein